MTSTVHTQQAPTSAGPTGWHAVVRAPMSAVAVIWLATAAMSVLAPDMVTGSSHEHLPVALLSIWVWAAVATTYTLMATKGSTEEAAPLVTGISAVWVAVLVAVVWAPVMVTGTDPTQIPMAVFVAPVIGAITTGILALHHATSA